MMSEKLRLYEQQKPEPTSHESLEKFNNSKELVQESNEALSKNIEQIREAVEKHSSSAHEKAENTERLRHSQERTEHRHYITKKIKADKYKQTLSDIRSQLSGKNRVFSKIIHQPIIESASEVGAKTIARPSGVLLGGIVGLFGSILILFYAKNIGFEVPASAYPILFIVGYFMGLAVEFTYKLITKTRSKRNALSYK